MLQLINSMLYNMLHAFIAPHMHHLICLNRRQSILNNLFVEYRPKCMFADGWPAPLHSIFYIVKSLAWLSLLWQRDRHTSTFPSTHSLMRPYHENNNRTFFLFVHTEGAARKYIIVGVSNDEDSFCGKG